VRWLIVLMSVTVASAYGGVGQWKIYTAKRQVRDLTAAEGQVWAVTSGGLFSYRLSDGAFAEYSTAEGLRSIDLTAITSDRQGRLWIGASSGFLHGYQPASNEWQYISDISIRNDPQKRINGLQASGDTLFILSDIGLSLFSISRLEFAGTYSRYGVGPSQLVGNVTGIKLFNGKIWLATRGGIASTPFTNTNPSAPESWYVYTTTQGLPSNDITALGVHNGKIVAGSSAGLSYFNDTTWVAVPGSAGMSVTGFLTEDPSCLNCKSHFIAKNQLWLLDENWNIELAYQFDYTLSRIYSESILATESAGLMVKEGASWDAKIPAGPPSNRFVGLAVDASGIVWSGTGSGNGEGFMSFDGKVWRPYNSNLDSRLGDNNYYKVSIGKDNSKWASNWGKGVALVDAAGNIQRVLNTSKGLPPSVGNDPFVVVGGVAVDADGVAWITNRTGRGDTALTKFNPDSSLSYVTGFNVRNPEIVFNDVVIDNYNTKWFANSGRFEPNTPAGFYYFNERYDIPWTVNGWGRLTTTDGLTSNRVWCVAVDRSGGVWIGSDQGITIIFDPTNPRSHVAAYHPLRDQIIQAIVVDPLNNKWVATKQGVFLLSQDGTSILERYTVESTNGLLLDNDVASIAMDVNSGTVYFGTEKGLSSLTTAAVTPNATYDNLRFSPNPYYLPAATPLSIDGLAEGSSIKIISVDGSLVREIRTPGGRIGFWDGRNEKGELVSSAVYLVIAYSEDGSQVAAGKIAVIRK